MKRILIAPNSFKECADSAETARLIYDSLVKIKPDIFKEYEIVQFPIADGGDGFLEVIKKHLNTVTRYFTVGSLFNAGKINCPVEYSEEQKIIYIESAKVIGLNLVPVQYRNPLLLNTAPLGELLLKINEEIISNHISADNVIIGIGGTATNDLGIGLLSKFGLVIYDIKGDELQPVPKNYKNVFGIEDPYIDLKYKITIVADVENMLLGGSGATRVFAKQKGADEPAIEMMEQGFTNLLNILHVGDEDRNNLSGAGGGLAAAFQLFFDVQLFSAKRFLLDYLGLTSKNSNFQIVITGEGILDEQTLLNKGAKIVVDLFRDNSEKIFFICGENKLYRELEFLEIIELSKYFKTSEDSIKRFPEGILKACERIINNYTV